ncbi:hypothetical protein [Prevotella disiens]|uniref:Uncharacterized protein n=1 Tax=Prevotella disiens DNF00882 TaxID=1401075 RepID=A0A096AUA3_9BACT|nr:hypothetical protein [Prevotella disiens]KGF50325.1 hypothetical protein HMPREF0654_01170 [Prevotella disiens DNF00882]
MKTTNEKNAQSVSSETTQMINVANQVTNEGINVEDATTTKGCKTNCSQSEPVESPKKRLLNLIEKKTGLNFESSNEYNEFYKTFAALKDANEGAFFAALTSVKKQWEDANKKEIERVENVAPVEFFEGLQNDNEIKNLLNDVFCGSFDYKNIIEGNYIICYCSEPKDNDNESINIITLKKLDLFGKEHAQTVYYKKLSCTRSNYLRAIRGYSFYLEGEKRLKNQLNKANSAFNDLRNIVHTLRDNGASVDDIIEKVKDSFFY